MKCRLVLMILGMSLAACAPVLDPPPVAAPPTVPPSPSAVPPPANRGAEAEAARAKIRSDLAAGNFPAALSRISREVRAGSSESRYDAEYPQVLNGLLRVAARDQEAGRFVEAGRFLRLALEAFPRDPVVAGQITAPPDAIRADLQGCAERLMEQGLLAYRAGRLEEAIGIWKGLLSFHPEHQPALKAVDTASLQLHNLRAIESGKQ